jgi:hypothetical protein
MNREIVISIMANAIGFSITKDEFGSYINEDGIEEVHSGVVENARWRKAAERALDQLLESGLMCES